MPVRPVLERFTDPVIAAGMLRALCREEWLDSAFADSWSALMERVAHLSQHPVLVLEILLATKLGKLILSPEHVAQLRNILLASGVEGIPQMARCFE